MTRPALRPVAPASTDRRIVPLDIFVALNLLLFGAMCLFTYYARFVQYRGAANIREFFLYAAVLVLGIVLLWRAFRGYRFGWGLLLLVQAGILAHFAGAFVQWDGHRLYDVTAAGIRYDKLVHFANAFVAVRVVRHIVERHGFRLDGLLTVLVGLAVLGLGGVVEIVEYLVVRTVPANGVGGYDNNMQDLVANAAGVVTSLVAGNRATRRAHAVTRTRERAFAGMPRWVSAAELLGALVVLLGIIWYGPAVLPRHVFPFVAVALLAAGLAWGSWVSPVLLHRDEPAARGLGGAGTWFVRTDNLREAGRHFMVLTLAGAVVLLMLAAWWNPGWAARADWRAWAVRLGFYAVSAQVQALVFVGFVVPRLRDVVAGRWQVSLAAAALFAAAHAPDPTVVALTATFALAAAWISVATPNVLAAGLSQTVLGVLLHRALEEPLRVGYFHAHPDIHVFREALPLVGRIIGSLY